MTVSKTTYLFLLMLFSASGWPAQETPHNRLILKVDENASGPYGGQKSSSCLRVYSDGRVTYARWWNSAATIVDSVAKKESRPEHTVSVEHRLRNEDVRELSRFLESKAVKRLPAKSGPPHQAIDYFESVSVEVFDSKGNSKKIFTREYYVADLVEKSRYPSALILLMDRIGQIEAEANDKGKSTEIPPDCTLK
jgi:hypothetical protein